MTHRTTRRRSLIVGTAMLAALALLASACGDDDDTTASTDTSDEDEAADTSDPVTNEDLAALLERPTEITNTTPFEGEVPEGKEIMWIQCPAPACVQLGEPLQDAVDVLGWTLSIVPHEGTPESVKAAYAQAVREKPDGVVSSGFPRSIFDPELAELADLGIPVVQVTVTDPPGDGISAVVNGPGRNAEVGLQMATFVADDSGGDANVLWVTAGFPILVPELEGDDGEKGFDPTLSELCDSCEVDSLEIPAESIGVDAPARIVATLQANPDVNYVVGAFGDLVGGLPGALSDAGLDDSVKIVTYTQNPALSAGLEDGSVAAVVGFPGAEDMWQVADTFLRIFTDQDFEALVNDLPSWIITADNVPSTTDEYPLVEDYQDQYKELWRIS